MTFNPDQETYGGRLMGNGYLCAILAAALWAVSGTLSKSLFNAGVTPFQLVQMRTTIASTVLLFWLATRQREALAVRRGDLVHFILLGLVLAASQVTYLYAISRIQVASAILLQYQAPVLIAAYALLFKHERLKPATLASIVVAVAGCYLVAGAYSSDILNLNRPGILSGLGSAAAFAVYTLKSDSIMRRYRPVTVVFYALLFAAVSWNILQLPLSAFAAGYGGVEWLMIISVGILGTVLPFLFYNAGIRRIGATRAGVTATMEPVFAGVLSFLFLGEVLQPLQVAGAGLVIAAIIALQIRHKRADQNPVQP